MFWTFLKFWKESKTEISKDKRYAEANKLKGRNAGAKYKRDMEASVNIFTQTC